MLIGGIDGCKLGWLLITYDGAEYSYSIHSSFQELLNDQPDIDRILIDIPIGLSMPDTPRTIDAYLRKSVAPRGSTVFNAPCRTSLYAPDFESARICNLKVEGKSLSLQSLHIMHKIREVDEYISSETSLSELYESHPELCFRYLNKKHKVVLSKKSTMHGINERLEILSEYEPQAHRIYEEIVKSTLRKHVKRDDIIDALCLCIVNKLGMASGLSLLTDENPVDSSGIPIRIAYYRAEN